MVIRSSLQYKMLRLVGIQAGFFVVVLATLWLINPKWVFWHHEQDPVVTQSLENFKYHYGLLSTLNMQLAQQRGLVEPERTELDQIGKQLHEHIQAVKQASLTAQQHFELDFTVLVHFLYNYKSKVAQLAPDSPEYEDALWSTVLYFSRIQSEFFFIVEEIDRYDTEFAQTQLQNAQNSLIIWGFASLGILVIGATIATNYTRVWKKQIAQLLAQVYRVSADDYYAKSPIHSDDELGFLAKAFNEAIERVKNKASNKL